MYTNKRFKHKSTGGIELEYIGYFINVQRYPFGYLYFLNGIRDDLELCIETLARFDTLEEAYAYVDAFPKLEV